MKSLLFLLWLLLAGCSQEDAKQPGKNADQPIGNSVLHQHYTYFQANEGHPAQIFGVCSDPLSKRLTCGNGQLAIAEYLKGQISSGDTIIVFSEEKWQTESAEVISFRDELIENIGPLFHKKLVRDSQLTVIKYGIDSRKAGAFESAYVSVREYVGFDNIKADYSLERPARMSLASIAKQSHEYWQLLEDLAGQRYKFPAIIIVGQTQLKRLNLPAMQISDVSTPEYCPKEWEYIDQMIEAGEFFLRHGTK